VCTDQEPTDGENFVATPSQLRSSSAHPPNDLVDVFDGYSFKGRRSVIIDDGGDVSEEEEDKPGDKDEEGQNITGCSIVAELNGTVVTEAAVTTVHEEPTPEPKTPEARPAALPPSTPLAKRGPLARRPELPPIDTTLNPASVAGVTPRASEGTTTPVSRARMIPVKTVADAAAAASIGPDIHHKVPKKVPASKSQGQRSNRQRTRREKSGIPALDRDVSDANDEDEVRMLPNEENEGWDFIEADGGGGEERYGPRGNSLFARGVVDRYRLAVFRKGSTPNRTSASVPGEAAGPSAGPNSPSPTIKEHRRGTGALPFRRTPKSLLRTKSPPSTSTRSSKSPGKLITTSDRSTSATVSTVSSPQSVRRTLGQPSLRSKESTVSVNSPGSSSDASTSGDPRAASDADVIETVRVPVHADEHEKHPKNNKKLKRGAEKMLSLFGSPR